MTPMKEGLDARAIKRIGSALHAIDPSLPTQQFKRQALQGLDALEMRERVSHLIQALHATLPSPFPKAAPLLRKIPKHWDFGHPDDPLRGFAAWPIIDYVAAYGLDHPKTALPLLKQLTHLFSAEFAIRPFFETHFDLTYQTVTQWLQDESDHVRRLVSEGSRPRLPWGARLNAFIDNPEPLIPLLDALKDDPSLYVRKSVANSLNDISKDHPEQVITLCKRWLKQPTQARQWITRHASRTLIKAGYPAAFELQGYSASPKVTVSPIALKKRKAYIGDTFTFSFQIESNIKQPQDLIIDYAIHLLKANGRHSRKVFKFKRLTLAGNEPPLRLEKSHSFKEVTTRRYYPGRHALEIIVNGVRHPQTSFTLFGKSEKK